MSCTRSDLLEGLGVVVLAYGSGGEVSMLIDDLRDQAVDAASILIVHNPNAAGEEPQRPAGVGWLAQEHNTGYAGGMNHGIQKQLAGGAAVVLALTQDVRLRPGTVRRLVAAADAMPEAGILGPVIHWRNVPGSSIYGGLSTRTGGIELVTERPRITRDGIAICHWLDGAAWLGRAEALGSVGPLEDRFFMYYEEIELCLRARRAGWKVGVALDAFAEHETSGSIRPGAYAYLRTRNGLEYARRAAGARGVAAGFWRTTCELVPHLRISASRRSPAEAKTVAQVRARGIARGIFDFVRRRFGPPPPHL